MYKIYFNKNYILFSDKEIVESKNTKIFNLLDTSQSLNTTKVLQKVENNKNVVILCADCAQVFGQFASFFEVREAAGGLVKSEFSRYLMILRDGVWDLPKGHLEKGETLEQCALREVQEECGLESIQLADKLCVTMHIYWLKKRYILKKCHWYAMYSSESEQLRAQAEEGIDKVIWASETQITELREYAYRSICDVFDVGIE